MSKRAVVKKVDSIEGARIEAGRAASVQVLIDAQDGAPNFALRKFSMGKDGGMPLHTNRVEHEQYVLSGSAEIRLGDERVTVQKGSTLFIPAGLPHSYSVIEAPFEFLCIVPNQEDRIEILEPFDAE